MDHEDGDVERAVRCLLGETVLDIGPPTRHPLEYDAFLAHRALARVSGAARTPHRRAGWSLIEKRTEGPALASPYLRANAERELAAYRSGLLDRLGEGVGAPRLLGSLVDAEGGITLWLEEVRHEGGRPLGADALVTVARSLGRLAGRWVGRAPREAWLFTGWIDRHSQPEARTAGEAALRGAAAIDALGEERASDALALLRAQGAVAGILSELPQTLCHHDAVGANVFTASGRTLLIDWESIGPGAVGADLASLLYSSVRRGDASATTVTGCLEEATDAYAEGVRAEHPGMSTATVRRGVDAAAALRWKLAADLAEGARLGTPPRRGSRPQEPADVSRRELLALVDLQRDAGRRLGLL